MRFSVTATLTQSNGAAATDTSDEPIATDGGWLFGNSFEEYGPARLSGMKKQTSWIVKGAGDLVFRTLTKITTTHYYKQGRGGGGRNYVGSRSQVQTFYWGFLAIADVAHVEGLINEHLVEPYLNRIHQA